MLFAAGWTVDDVLDLTWDQLMCAVTCTVQYKTEQINMFMEIASTALGGKSKKAKKKSRKSSTLEQKQEKEAALLRGIGAAGLPIAIE